MQMKTIFLTLCVGLAFVAGCGRSKPQASKTADVDTSALENAAPPPPPDQLPPKSAAVPAPPQQAAVPTRPGSAVSFGPLPPGTAVPGRPTRQEEINKMWQPHDPKQKQSRRAQPPAQNNGGQSQ